jgi:hypothetical protein
LQLCLSSSAKTILLSHWFPFHLALLSQNHHNQPPAAQAACGPPSTPAFGQGVALQGGAWSAIPAFSITSFSMEPAPHLAVRRPALILVFAL